MGATYTLVIESGEQAGRRVAVAGPATTLGREPDSGIALADHLVSRQHLRLEPGRAGLVVTDLGSSNGTRVNGRPIAGPHVLAPGDVLEVGETRLRLEGGEPGAAVPAAPRPAGLAGGAAAARRPEDGLPDH